MAGLTRPPEWLITTNIKGLGRKRRREAVEVQLKHYSTKGRVLAVFIDGDARIEAVPFNARVEHFVPRNLRGGHVEHHGAAGAWGGDSAPATAAEREAQARFEEGLARVKANNFEGARMSFTQAYAVLRKPAILWNLALSEDSSFFSAAATCSLRSFG